MVVDAIQLVVDADVDTDADADADVDESFGGDGAGGRSRMWYWFVGGVDESARGGYGRGGGWWGVVGSGAFLCGFG